MTTCTLAGGERRRAPGRPIEAVSPRLWIGMMNGSALGLLLWALIFKAVGVI